MPLQIRRFLFFIVLLAIIVRLGMVWLNYQSDPSYFHNDFEEVALQVADSDVPYQNRFGSELSNVAYALVCSGEGLANPFGGNTGPTGWASPGMVLLYALAFKLFGCFSTGSILFMFSLALCLSVATIILIFHVCLRLFNSTKIACVASFLYAFDPQDVLIFKKTGQQDFNVFPFLFLLCFFLFLRCLRSRSVVDRLLFGFVSGAAMLCNPVFVLPVSACCLYYVIINRRSVMRAAREMAVVALMCALLVSPYIVYQYQQLHTWSFVKSNGLFELYLGNVPDFEGVLTLDLFRTHHPMMNSDEYRAYRDMGEKAYVHSKMTVFLDTFDPVRFVSLSVRRFMYFFFLFPGLQRGSLAQHLVYSLRGLALIVYAFVFFRRLRSIDALVYAYIFAYALPFFFMGMMYRYSFPIVPLSAILGACLVCSCRSPGNR